MPRLASRFAALAAVLSLLGGCVSSFAAVEGQPHMENLGSDGSAYIALPQRAERALFDFGGGELQPQDASAFLKTAIAEEVGVHLDPVSSGDQPESTEQALASAKSAGAKYTMTVQVHGWAEGQNTIITSRADSAQVRVLTFDTESGALLDVTDIWSQNDLFLGFGDNESLFREAVAAFAAERFSPASGEERKP